MGVNTHTHTPSFYALGNTGTKNRSIDAFMGLNVVATY